LGFGVGEIEVGVFLPDPVLWGHLYGDALVGSG